MRAFELFDFENFKMSFLNVSPPPSTRIFSIFRVRVYESMEQRITPLFLTAMPKSTLRPCIGWHCSRLKLATTATSYTETTRRQNSLCHTFNAVHSITYTCTTVHTWTTSNRSTEAALFHPSPPCSPRG